MSAPDTDLEKQQKRHRGPIWGITLGLVFVAILALGAFVWPGVPLDRQAAPDGAPTEVTEDGNATASPAIVDSDAGTTEDGQ